MHDQKDCDVICFCSGTTNAQILTLLKQGVVDMDRISRITGALSGCGGCEFELQSLLQLHQKTIKES